MLIVILLFFVKSSNLTIFDHLKMTEIFLLFSDMQLASTEYNAILKRKEWYRLTGM